MIRSIHAARYGTWGSPRIHQELKSRRNPVSKALIQR
ncbi:IS3 family transposase [Chitinivorax tropicus]